MGWRAPLKTGEFQTRSTRFKDLPEYRAILYAYTRSMVDTVQYSTVLLHNLTVFSQTEQCYNLTVQYSTVQCVLLACTEIKEEEKKQCDNEYA